ncbi:phage portal protein [Labrenzia sp. R4_2]|uniref:phage portal protein n=1 Tax=Labrenzia sp. R4_2 TaxID=2821107 RepID=UPI001ADCCAE1|nr:phage portal protein [Labrenzia sp. R4_2]MBO9422328.1 phage portal protein [Labrenzia sp. R4_2]
MLRALSRLFSSSPSRRSLDAAGGGRRWQDAPASANVGTIHASASTIGMRAQHFTLNNPTGARITESLASNLVGDGIKPRSEHEDEAVRRVLQRLWKAWTDEADAEGQTDFYGLQQFAVRDLVVFGEVLFVFTYHPETGAPQLRRLHPEQLDRTKDQMFDHGGRVYQGVEFDAAGRRVAYWIRQSLLSGDALAGYSLAPVRIPASEVIHLFRQLVPGQVRGLSWFASVLLAAKELDSVLDALIVRARVAALHAGFITDTDGNPAYDGQKSDGTLTAGLEPGALINLPPGKDIRFPDTPDQGGASDLLTTTFRLIASGTNTTYEQATGDYSNVNYSSARQAFLEYRRFCQTIQHHLLVFGLCRPVWKAFIQYQVLQGVIPARDYTADRSAFDAVKWLPPAWPWVDPKNDAIAAEKALKNHLRSRSEIIAERGYDAEDVDAEIAADAKRLKDHKIIPSPDTSTESE